MASEPDWIGCVACEDTLNLVLIKLVLEALRPENRVEYDGTLLARLQEDLAALVVREYDLDWVPAALYTCALLFFLGVGRGILTSSEFFCAFNFSSSMNRKKTKSLEHAYVFMTGLMQLD